MMVQNALLQVFHGASQILQRGQKQFVLGVFLLSEAGWTGVCLEGDLVLDDFKCFPSPRTTGIELSYCSRIINIPLI